MDLRCFWRASDRDHARTGNPLLFTGREHDSETGLYYYRARYYDPEIGRFITEDSLRFEAGVNFYAYCSNNPIRFNDPTGHYAGLDDLIAIGAGAVLGVGAQGVSDLVSFCRLWNLFIKTMGYRILDSIFK